MPYPSQPSRLKKRAFGISLDEEMAERLSALAGKPGERSMFIRDTLVIGLERRFGPQWSDLADRQIAQQKQVVA